MPDTWNGTDSNGLITGNSLRDGATATGDYTITTTIPSDKNKKGMTKDEVETYTDISIGNTIAATYASNQIVTKQSIIPLP